MTGITLLDYQADFVGNVRAAYAAGSRAVLGVLPTGGGKTYCFSYITQRAAARAKADGKPFKILLLAHRKELVGQISRALKVFGVGHGVIRPDVMPSNHAVQVAMVQTLAKRIKLDRAQRYIFDMVIVDEAHHAVADSLWGEVLAYNLGALLLGLTATPCRLDGKGLGVEADGFFDALVAGPTLAQLIERGNLARPVIYAPKVPLVLDKVGVRSGEFKRAQLADAVDWEAITHDAVGSYTAQCAGQSAIGFCVSVEAAYRAADRFKAAGFSAAALEGKTPDRERDRMIRDLGNGSLNVLFSKDVISEGTDIPRVAAVIGLRPTASWSLYMQQIGRGLRRYPGKETAIILDHVDNVRRHGLPTDDVEWSLMGVTKRASEAAVKRCECGLIVSVFVRSCECGRSFERAGMPVKADLVAKPVNGELIELTPEMAAQIRDRKRSELVAARTYEELVRLGRQRKYKDPEFWAKQIMQGRDNYRAQFKKTNIGASRHVW